LGIATTLNGSLEKWAQRGVLLLNTRLNVYEGETKSKDFEAWLPFTDEILRHTMMFPQGIVYILWGKNANDAYWRAETGRCINKRRVLASTHPSPLSARRSTREFPAFAGSRPFSKANEALRVLGEQPIDWRL
jgi:uracil-DNA glycosylase